MRALTTEDHRPVSLLQRERPLRADLMLVIPYLALSALGLLMIYSASAPRLEALGLDPGRELKRQALFVVLGFVGFALASLIDVKTLRSWVPLSAADLGGSGDEPPLIDSLRSGDTTDDGEGGDFDEEPTSDGKPSPDSAN